MLLLAKSTKSEINHFVYIAKAYMILLLYITVLYCNIPHRKLNLYILIYSVDHIRT